MASLTGGRVFDCFTFDHEFDLLELRLRELEPLNAVHVLVEAPLTFSGRVKPLHFAKCEKWFKPYAERIVYHNAVASIHPAPGKGELDPYGREHAQRQAILRALSFPSVALAPEDTVLVSDADEIPRPEAVLVAAAALHASEPPHEAVALDCRFFECHMDTVLREHCPSILAYRGDAVLSRNLSHDKWAAQQLNPPVFPVVPNGGWHFSGLGGPWRLWEKHTSYAEPTPIDHDEVAPDYLATRLGGAWSVVDKGSKLKLVDVDASWPRDVLRRPERWRPFMYRPETFTARCGNPAAPRPMDS